MKNKIVFIALVLTGLSGCKSKSAFNYSQEIVAKEKSLIPDMESTENKVVKFIETGHYDSIAMAGEYMEGRVQEKIDEINKMPVPRAKEADSFKKATLQYFRFIKNLYTVYKNLGNAKTEDERGGVLKNLQKLVDEKQTVINDMQKAQRKFASANGFRIE